MQSHPRYTALKVELSAGAYCVFNERYSSQIRLHIFIHSSVILPLSYPSMRCLVSPLWPPGPPYPSYS